MIFKQLWEGWAINNGVYDGPFPVEVPGNIQKNYAEYKHWPDFQFMDNCKQYLSIEDYFWSYKTKVNFAANEGERVFFVSKGIEYEFEILLRGEKLFRQEGMYTKVELDLTDRIKNGDELEVLIYPHPKRPGAPEGRTMADQCCKPPVEYGWDWAPRMLISGLWNDTFIEVRNSDFIGDVEVLYTLSQDLKSADVSFDFECENEAVITFADAEGNVLYEGSKKSFTLGNIKLWWCNEQGQPYLYRWEVKCGKEKRQGRVGFKKVRLVMNEGAWEEPSEFPKSRSTAPVTVELNGRRIFAKGSNWVNPQVFTALISDETYKTLLTYVRDAHMNILRCWGGAIINKDAFYDYCDEMGIMVWQEFPLACNNYIGTARYLGVLEQEASSIIRRVRGHACHILWCGGNELFNSWSGMTDQSHALRLLDKLCYELDRDKPYIKTAPLFGMGHGHYEFAVLSAGNRVEHTVFELYRKCRNTAYSEFGTPCIASMEQLKKILTPELLERPEPGTAWETHHGLKAWRGDSWTSYDMIEAVFGRQQTLEDYIEKSVILQCEGLKCIFEEARRQKGGCSMAMNWCFNEPWVTAAGNCLIAYPAVRKDAYYSVQSALRPVMPSIRLEHFIYHPGDVFHGELWLLNDSTEDVSDTVTVYIEMDGTEKRIMTWETGEVKANKNLMGNAVNFVLPEGETQLITVSLKASCAESTYRVLFRSDGAELYSGMNNI